MARSQAGYGLGRQEQQEGRFCLPVQAMRHRSGAGLLAVVDQTRVQAVVEAFCCQERGPRGRARAVARVRAF